MKVPLSPKWKSFSLQLNYRELPSLSALNTLISTYIPSATSSFSSFLFLLFYSTCYQNYFLSAKQQPHLLCRIFAWSSTTPSARNSLWSFSGTNRHANPSLAHDGSDAKGFQRASHDTSSHHREPTWNIAIDGGSVWACGNEIPRDSWLEICGSTFRRLPSSWEEAGSAENPITIDEDEDFSETMIPFEVEKHKR